MNKNKFYSIAVSSFLSIFYLANSQSIKSRTDSALLFTRYNYETCPSPFKEYLEKDSLNKKAALFVFNMILSPVEKNVFRDNGLKFPGLNSRFKMKHCTILLIDTGVHSFHTVYQKPSLPILFQAGDIYFSEIITRKAWPPLFPVRKKDIEGKRIEYGLALMYFIKDVDALNRWEKLHKKKILMNR